MEEKCSQETYSIELAKWYIEANNMGVLEIMKLSISVIKKELTQEGYEKCRLGYPVLIEEVKGDAEDTNVKVTFTIIQT